MFFGSDFFIRVFKISENPGKMIGEARWALSEKSSKVTREGLRMVRDHSPMVPKHSRNNPEQIRTKSKMFENFFFKKYDSYSA